MIWTNYEREAALKLKVKPVIMFSSIVSFYFWLEFSWLVTSPSETFWMKTELSLLAAQAALKTDQQINFPATTKETSEKLLPETPVYFGDQRQEYMIWIIPLIWY